MPYLTILCPVQRDFNPNYQDMAVLGATRAFKDWQVANGLADKEETTEQGEVTNDEPAQATREVPEHDDADLSDQHLNDLEGEDPLSLIDSLATRVGVPAPGQITASTLPLVLLGRKWIDKFSSLPHRRLPAKQLAASICVLQKALA